jgi:hypothetical protein
MSLMFLALKASHYTAKPLILLVDSNAHNIDLKYAWKLLLPAWFTGIFAAVAGIWFGFLHCWCNLWSEILVFGDRRFYKEWWKTNSLSDFLISWNTVVQEWLKEYIYDPCKIRFGKKWAGPMVMFFSGFLHDYFVLVPASAYIPASIVIMTVTVIIPTHLRKSQTRTSDNKRHININNNQLERCPEKIANKSDESSTVSFLSGSWCLFVIGLSYWPYLGEYYARKVCPHQEVTLESLFTLRGFYCFRSH